MLCMQERFTGKRNMPRAMAYDTDSWPGYDTFIGVVAFDCLCLPVADLPASIDFYGDLFAMRIVAGGAAAGRVVLSRGGRVRLALYAYGGAGPVPFVRIAASVESLEAARDTAWNLGIAAVRELGDDADDDSFAIADPDGHEIGFVERSRAARSA